MNGVRFIFMPSGILFVVSIRAFAVIVKFFAVRQFFDVRPLNRAVFRDRIGKILPSGRRLRRRIPEDKAALNDFRLRTGARAPGNDIKGAFS